jgi:hypothetical protein
MNIGWLLDQLALRDMRNILARFRLTVRFVFCRAFPPLSGWSNLAFTVEQMGQIIIT